MKIQTGKTASMRANLAQDVREASKVDIPLMKTETSRVTDVRRSVFIELRERGSDSCIAVNKTDLHPTPPSRRQHSRYNPFFDPKPMINIWRGVEQNSFVEIYVDKQNALTVKPCKLENLCTPYVFVHGTPQSSHEIFLATKQASIISTLALREQFTKDVYRIARVDNPMYKVSALKAMEVYFFTLAQAGKLDATYAEKRWDKYEKLAARIWRGATPAEQVTSFRLAFRMLADATSLKNLDATEDSNG